MMMESQRGILYWLAVHICKIYIYLIRNNKDDKIQLMNRTKINENCLKKVKAKSSIITITTEIRQREKYSLLV